MKRWAKRLLDRMPIQHVPVRVFGGLARGARWTLYPYSAYWRGSTEPDVERVIREHGCKVGSVCWDLGAHFGIYTVGMAMAVGSTGEVACFEPDPVSFSRCRRHVAMNALSCVRLYDAAASDGCGFAPLIQSNGPGASTSHFAYEDEGTSAHATRVTVPTIRLDDLVTSRELRQPDFIKVDVEGHAAKALLGAHDTLARARPPLLISFHSVFEADDVRTLLEPLGYKTFSCEGQEVAWKDVVYRTALLKA